MPLTDYARDWQRRREEEVQARRRIEEARLKLNECRIRLRTELRLYRALLKRDTSLRTRFRDNMQYRIELAIELLGEVHRRVRRHRHQRDAAREFGRLTQ